MKITLSGYAAICQSVAEVYLTGVAPLGAVSHRFNFLFLFIPTGERPLGRLRRTILEWISNKYILIP